MRPIIAMLKLVVLFTLVETSSVFGQDAANKSPVPAEAAQADATKLVKEVYGDEWAAAKTTTEKQALAKKLLENASETKDNPVGRFVLLRIARDIATQANDGQTAFQAIDAMAETFQVDALELKMTVLTKFASVAQKPARHKSIADDALKLESRAVSQDNYSVADKFGKLALDEARQAHDGALVTEAQGRVAEVSEQVKAYEEVKIAKVTLEKTPDDPEANLAVGRYLCFVKGDWDRGLPMLALGKDEDLKALAKQELAGAASSTEQATLGDGWWNWAEKQDGAAKKQMQGRAIYWYQKALPDLSGLMQAKVEKRLRIVSGAQEVQTGEHPPKELTHDYVALLPRVEVARDRVIGEWNKDSGTGSLTVVGPRHHARIMLPAIVNGEYDVVIRFTRASGKDHVCIILPIGSRVCSVILSACSGKCNGLERIDGRSVDNNPTTSRPGTLVNGKNYELLIKVRTRNENASIQVFLDKALAIRWQGSEASLSPAKESLLPDVHRIGLYVCEPTTFHSAQLKMVSGQAEWVK